MVKLVGETPFAFLSQPNLTDCILMADAVGDVSKVRVHIQAHTLSCTLKDGSNPVPISKKIKAHVDDEDGDSGLRGYLSFDGNATTVNAISGSVFNVVFDEGFSLEDALLVSGSAAREKEVNNSTEAAKALPEGALENLSFESKFKAWNTYSWENCLKHNADGCASKAPALSELCIDEQNYIRQVIRHIDSGKPLSPQMKRYIRSYVGGAVLMTELRKHISKKVSTGKIEWARGEITLDEKAKASGLAGDENTFHPAVVLTPFELAVWQMSGINLADAKHQDKIGKNKAQDTAEMDKQISISDAKDVSFLMWTRSACCQAMKA